MSCYFWWYVERHITPHFWWYVEHTFIHKNIHVDRKRNKLPSDRCAFKFEFGEHEGKQDLSEIVSFLKSLKRSRGILFSSNPNEIENNKYSLVGCCFRNLK
jgi:hypothetical protein